MHTITYQFPGVASRPPLSSVQNDPVVLQLAPLYTDSSSNGTPYLLGTVASVSFASGQWRYVVNLPQNAITGSPAGKFLPTLSAFNPTAQFLRSRPQHLNFEVWGPQEPVAGNRWVGNLATTGRISAIQIATATPGSGTAQILLGNSPIFPAPIQLTQQVQLLEVNANININGQIVNAVGTSSPYGGARGLQITLLFSPTL
jgi:hypothetical protein